MSEITATANIAPISIVKEMEKSYLDYAMSVIVSRALPDVRDGLKPVHRRILWAQHNMGNRWNTRYIKSARVTGETMGKYHPHGNQAIYDAMVRMAQDFSMGLMLEDGQGNFGSMDGDPPAAERYTEVRMARAAEYMLQDIGKDTVDFRPNYDGQDQEPVVLPARFPNLLVNGANGIAVGMATSIPTHNLGEVIDATIAIAKDPSLNQEELNNIILGPDFPTGGTIIGRKGILSGQATGRGSVTLRAKHRVEEKGSKEVIIVEEIPYQVNKENLVAKIGELARDKVVEDIAELRDESSREGVRVVIELKRGGNADVVMNQLYKNSQMQNFVSYNMLALDRGMPRQMGILEILHLFLKHREEVIQRRTKFDLMKARERAHILAGLALSVANIDDIIKIIRHAPDPATAKAELLGRAWDAAPISLLLKLLGEPILDGNKYNLSNAQAQAILDLRLHRLTGLEQDKINAEAGEIAEIIENLVAILSDRSILMGILTDELEEVKERFAVPRKTDIIEGSTDMDIADLIAPEDIVVTISSDGYIKRQPVDAYRAQKRGGKGKSLAKTKEGELIDHLFVANTHDTVLFFSNRGQVYKLFGYQLPAATAQSRGKAIVNLLPLNKLERITGLVSLPAGTEMDDTKWVLFATRAGMIRKTPLKAFANISVKGIKGMGLNEGDELIAAKLCLEADADVLMSTRHGQAARFRVGDLRPVASRTGLGVRGMKLRNDDQIISMYILSSDKTHVLSVTENGYGKRSRVSDYTTKGRGGVGIISIKTSERNGEVVTSMPVGREDEVMIATADGQIIRTGVDGISISGRSTQGVKLYGGEGKVTLVSRVPAMEKEVETEEGEASRK